MSLTRRQCRAELALTMGDTGVGLVEETTTSAGGATSPFLTLVCTGLTQQSDYWNGGQVIITSSTYIGEVRRVTDFASGGTVTVGTSFTGQIGSGVTFQILLSHVYAEYNSAFNRALRYARNRNRFLKPYLNQSIELSASYYEYVIPRGKIVSGTADSGTTTTLVDSALTQADNYWIGAKLSIIGGTNVGKYRYITDSDQSDTSITFDAFDSAIGSTSQFYLERFEPVYLHRIEALVLDDEWRDIGHHNWEIVRQGDNPILKFTPGVIGQYASYTIRLLGQRLPSEFVNDLDECEVDEEFLFVFAEQILRGSQARRSDLDMEDNRNRRKELRAEAEGVLASDHERPFPSARRCR